MILKISDVSLEQFDSLVSGVLNNEDNVVGNYSPEGPFRAVTLKEAKLDGSNPSRFHITLEVAEKHPYAGDGRVPRSYIDRLFNEMNLFPRSAD